MRFQLPTADLFIPDALEPAAALARTTHLAEVRNHHPELGGVEKS